MRQKKGKFYRQNPRSVKKLVFCVNRQKMRENLCFFYIGLL